MFPRVAVPMSDRESWFVYDHLGTEELPVGCIQKHPLRTMPSSAIRRRTADFQAPTTRQGASLHWINKVASSANRLSEPCVNPPPKNREEAIDKAASWRPSFLECSELDATVREARLLDKTSDISCPVCRAGFWLHDSAKSKLKCTDCNLRVEWDGPPESLLRQIEDLVGVHP